MNQDAGVELVTARVTGKEKADLERVARTHDRTLSREVRRAIRFYLSHLQEAEAALSQAVGS